MLAALSQPLGSTLDLQRRGELAPAIGRGFEEALGRKPDPDDLETWRSVLPLVLGVAAEAIPHSAHVFVECPLPFNGQRIDLVFLGGSSGTPSAHLVELKHWQQSDESRLRTFVEVAGHPTLHPSYQVLSYSGKLKHLHSFGPSMEIDQSAVILDGLGSHSAVLAPKFRRQLEAAPAYFAPDLGGFGERLSRGMTQGVRAEWVEALIRGEYAQSDRLLQMVREHQGEILQRSAEVLAASGWGLTEDQQLVHDEVLEAIERGERAVFCVSGGPGSGKSLLAMHVFLESIGLGRRTILAVRNNRLNASLRDILESEVTGAQGMIKYFSAGNAGVEDDSRLVADVLVCDEAQRLALKSPNVFLRAPVVVLVYDENQILNAAERGTSTNLEGMARRVGVAPSMRALPTPVRCRGGARYLAWVRVSAHEERQDRLMGNTPIGGWNT